jgi:tetratricopeptide (TPR) repeat protein
MRIVKTVFLLCLTSLLLGAEVRVWQGSLTLPTYQEGLPDTNPPFDALSAGRLNYPYTIRDRLTDQRGPQAWRAIFIENEYLKCSVLPDLGGHIYSCMDKTNGAELFYANPSIKKALVSNRGAWAAFGVEFNFPVSHNWVTVSPVDFAIRQHPDGSASIWVGNVDRVYGMQWRVELILRPGSTVLEQRIRLYNPGAVRRRYYWWNNAAVESWDDTRIYYPQNFSASHGFTFVDSWPVNSQGLDQSRLGNHVKGPVSQFAYATREPYMGIYHPRTQAGVVHFAWPSDAPAKKLWSWGVDPEGKAWRKALSDNDSAYLEVQGGLFRNQETYAFLEPQEAIEFSEYWMPVREIGGIARANLHAIVNFEHGSLVRLGINATHVVENGLLRIRDGNRTVSEDRVSLDPAKTFFRDLPAGPVYSVELLDAQGKLLLSHTEGQYDMAKPSDIQTGPQPAHEFPEPDQRSAGDFLEIGVDHELNGRNLDAWETYGEGLLRFRDSFALHKAAGRLAVTLLRYEEAIEHLRFAQRRRSNDPDIHYYLGLALAASGETSQAQTEFEHAHVFREYRAAARLELAFLAAEQRDYAMALDWTRRALAESPDAIRLGVAEVALLRKLGRTKEAQERQVHWLQFDPASSALRFEATLSGASDDALWSHLAADPERVLDLTSLYINLGMVDTAAELLEHHYPAVEAAWSEPGTVLPQQHPLIAYYLAYCRERLGRPDAADHYRDASGKSTLYVFPNRAGTLPVLRAALTANSSDATAHFLLGNLWMSGGLTERAIEEWQKARALQAAIPTLHRNLGYGLLFFENNPQEASAVLREGLGVDPSNVALYLGLDQALAVLQRPASERALALAKFPDPRNMPTSLVYARALALAEAGQFAEAQQLFRGRFFAMEELGTGVGQVYLEVELMRASALTRAGKRDEARALMQSIGQAPAGMPFPSDSLSPLLNEPRYQFAAGEIYAALGDRDQARQHWQKATGGQPTAFALLAAKRLNPDDQSWRGRAESALQRTGGQAGLAYFTRGALLRELGRTSEAEAEFRSAVLAPDRGLSQLLGRQGLASLRQP